MTTATPRGFRNVARAIRARNEDLALFDLIIAGAGWSVMAGKYIVSARV
jgi:hypothetical protein